MYSYVHVCTRMYTYVYVCIRMYTCVYLRIRMYTYVYVRIRTYTYVYVRIRMYVRIRTYTYICIYVYMYYMYICIYGYMYIFICNLDLLPIFRWSHSCHNQGKWVLWLAKNFLCINLWTSKPVSWTWRNNNRWHCYSCQSVPWWRL